MKKWNIAVVAVALVAGMISVAGAEDKVTGDVYAGPSNKYVFRGVDLSGNQMVIQGGADLSYKNFTLSVWSNWQSAAKGDYQSSTITETDVTLNYAFTPVELLTFNVGNTFYSLNSKNPAIRDTNELYLKTTLNTLLAPTFTTYWDYDESNGKAGLYFTLGVSHTLEVTKELGINLGGLVGYNCDNYSAGAGRKNFQNYELSLSADYAVTPVIKISPSYLFSNAISATGRAAGLSHENIYGVKAAFNF